MAQNSVPTDIVAPSTVDGEDGMIMSRDSNVAVPVETEKKSSRKKSGKVSPPVVVSESWKPSDFMRDASWFVVHCGLPNHGENPHKISYVTDTQLANCFGEKQRNGYKLNSCTGMPVEDIAALCQVIDGYDKPVNGVLSHTFVKGAYAERVLKKPVDWASYAASKLRGQIVQWEREGKGKPVGPPCVRKPRLYVWPPLEVASKQIIFAPPDLDTLRHAPEMPQGTVPKGMETAIVEFRGVPVPPPDNTVGETPGFELQPTVESREEAKVDPDTSDTKNHLLLAILKSEMITMRAREEEIIRRISKVDESLNKVTNMQESGSGSESMLNDQRKYLDNHVRSISCDITTEEGVYDDLTTEIELELNKQSEDEEMGEVNTALVSMLEGRQVTLQGNIDQLKSQLVVTSEDLKKTLELIALNERKRAELPHTMKKLTSVHQSLEADRLKVRANIVAQSSEWATLSAVLSQPCPIVLPRFTLTSVETQTNFHVSTCPVCCFGYAECNWIPASCGHAYHPSCLFPLISVAKKAPQCMACGIGFSSGWLRAWGFPWKWENDCGTESYVRDRMAADLRDVYGKNASRLEQRRKVAGVLNCGTPIKADLLAGDEQCDGSPVPCSTVDLSEEDYCDEGSSRNPKLLTPMLTPKVEGAIGNKRKAPGSGSLERKVKPSSNAESWDAHTPNSTLPFSPETDVTFKPYGNILTPLKRSARNGAPVASTKRKKKLSLA